MEKEELIKKIMNCCFADDSGNFWEKFKNWEPGQTFYTSRIDPDQKSKKLYRLHEFLCNLQGLKVSIPKDNNCELVIDDKNIRLSSDSIMSIYWHWSGKRYPYKQMQEIIESISSELQKENENNKHDNHFKEFIKSYLQKANTIGGFVVFPKHYLPTVNTDRGRSGKIRDRFDLTLECIRRYYNNEESPLFDILKKDEDFFDLFRKGKSGFENYAKFFCLNGSYNGKHNWITEDCSAVYDLMSENGEQTLLKEGWPEKILPFDYTSEEEKVAKWWTFYRNIMDRLNARNKQIEKLLSDCSDDELQKLYNSLDLD